MPYLDHAATTPMLPEAREAWLQASALTGNAQSLHASGRAARRVVEEARESVAADLGVRPSEVVFTGGGTEADNLILQGRVRAARAAGVASPRVIVSAIEHHAVLDPAEWLARHDGVRLDLVPVDSLGRVDPATVAGLLGPDVAVCSVMWANNEIGTVQPIAEIAELCRSAGVVVHSDAVQAIGVLPVDASIVDSISLSGHKLGGPAGVGVLTVLRDVDMAPLTLGGGQEKEPRPGTPDVPSIAAFATALRITVAGREAHAAELERLRARLIDGVASAVPSAVLNGDQSSRLPGTVHYSFPGCEGDALLMLLDAAGIECSTGSACTAGIPQPSHVLLAMGLPEDVARGSLRFSIGRGTTDADIDALIAVLPGVVERASTAGLVRKR